jgi:hypothetical protein
VAPTLVAAVLENPNKENFVPKFLLRSVLSAVLALSSVVFSSHSFADIGDPFTIASLNVPGYGNYAVTLVVTSHKNTLSTTFQLQGVVPTNAPTTATYDLGTGIVTVPNIRATFQGMTGPSCQIYDASFGPFNGYWATTQVNWKGTC